jgi:hypothetical protein
VVPRAGLDAVKKRKFSFSLPGTDLRFPQSYNKQLNVFFIISFRKTNWKIFILYEGQNTLKV